MKSLFYLSILMFLFIGCEKESYDSPECIIGKWEWISRCGGFTGGCSYPSEDHQERIEFTSDNRYLRFVNGIKDSEIEYSFGDTNESDGIKYFEIKFSTGWKTVFWFSDQKALNLPGGDFIDKFKRID